MLSRTVNQLAQSPWGRLVWAGVAVLALVQVAALYRLCTTQVARAQARESSFTEQRNAMTDCLDYLKKSTISSCARQAASSVGTFDDGGSLAARDMPRVRSVRPAAMSAAVPVSYVYH